MEKRKKTVLSDSISSTNITTDALFDPHFRKQKHFGPEPADVAIKVAQALGKHEPISLVGLMFTRKNICPLKRGDGNESHLDFAEIASLVHLNNFAKLIANFHPYGSRYIILSEGTRFLEAFDLCLPLIRLYQKRLKTIVDTLHLDHIDIQDYEDFLSEHLSSLQIEMREENHQKALRLYRERMLPIFDVHAFESTLTQASTLDPISDPRNPRGNFVPLWDSMKHSLPYPELLAIAEEKGIPYVDLYQDIFRNLYQRKIDPTMEKLRQYVLERSWHKAIQHNACVLGDNWTSIDVGSLISDVAFRTSINPKPGNHLGIYAIRETSARVQPWHGKAYLQTDASGRFTTTVLSRLEIETKHHGTPVILEEYTSSPFFYTDEKGKQQVAGGENLAFNLATRDVNIPSYKDE